MYAHEYVRTSFFYHSNAVAVEVTTADILQHIM